MGMNSAYTQSLNRLIEELAKLPGIGTKKAEKLIQSAQEYTDQGAKGE